MTRAELIAQGYRDLYAQGDLRARGWQIRHWFHPGTGDHRIEYVPVSEGELASKEQLHSIIVGNYEEQAAFHRSIGVQVVPPGETFDDLGNLEQQWLY